VPSASPAAAAPSPSAVGATTSPPSGAAPTATSVTLPEVVWIGNSNGTGVYLRNSPHDDDRAGVLGEGTRVTITGEQSEGDGKQWFPVTTENNEQGYVQVEYVTRTEPKEAPAPPTGEPK
jgi:Bacterial SH3 domain